MVFLINAASLLFAVLLSLSLANAHPGEVEAILTKREQQLHQLAVNKRHAVVRNCDSAIAAYEAKRRTKRSAMMQRKREEEAHDHGPPPESFAVASHKQSGSASAAFTTTSSAASPSTSANSTTYASLQNTTCVLTPEAEEGPYYIHEPLIRNDIRDGMTGVPLTLDIGVMDVTTCTVIENAMVDIWSCNATGIYSGFIASESSNLGNTSTSTGTVNSSLSASASFSSSASIPSGSAGAGGGGMAGSVATDQQTFGRGAYPTDAEGLVEFETIFPGFYTGRAVHIHTVVLLDYLTNANGTVGVEAGHIQHIGQSLSPFKFQSVEDTESWTADVVATAPYNTETVTRTTNAEDRDYAIENTAGYNATAQLATLGDDISDGLLGYITLGINPAASYELNSVSYYTGNSTD